MPLEITNTAGGMAYGNPLVGDPGPPDHIKVDVSGLTIDEVDKFGYLKPGVLFARAGTLVGAADFAYGITVESQKIVPANPTNVTLAAVTADPLIAVITGGLINRDIVEDNLGRALTADELDGIVTAGSGFRITST